MGKSPAIVCSETCGSPVSAGVASLLATIIELTVDTGAKHHMEGQ
jgi:hypothetical protein